MITFLPGSPHGWQMSTCPWGWFILQHWAGLKRLDKLRGRVERRRKKENASKHRRERRWKWGLKRNESGLITGHPQLFFFLDHVRQNPEPAGVAFSVNIRYIMLICRRGGNRRWYVRWWPGRVCLQVGEDETSSEGVWMETDGGWVWRF